MISKVPWVCVRACVRWRWTVACALVALCTVHCSRGGGDGDSDDFMGGDPPVTPGEMTADELGRVSLALAEIPAEISCLRVSAAGGERTLVRDFDVAPGQPFSAVLHAVPLGAVMFFAGAYPGACADVTASTNPSWISEEVAVAVVLGRQVSVALTLHRNGRAKVTVDFADEPACTASGAVCLSSSQCCSRSCARGLCQGPADAGEAAGADSPPDAAAP